MRDTIDMARETKMPYDFVTGEPIYLEKLKAFEALIRADERNRTWTQEHWTEYERSIAEAEREACAKVCEEVHPGLATNRIAQLIRARGNT